MRRRSVEFSHIFIQGNPNIIFIISQVRARQSALDILRREYESAKARVRRCREEHGGKRGSTSSMGDSQLSGDTTAAAVQQLQQQQNQQQQQQVSALEEEAKKLRAVVEELRSEKEDVRILELHYQSHTLLEYSKADVQKEALSEERDRLMSEMGRLQRQFEEGERLIEQVSTMQKNKAIGSAIKSLNMTAGI